MTTLRSEKLRFAVPMGLSALMLAVSGALSPASAATHWAYQNGNGGGPCLSSTSDGGSATALSCANTIRQQWYWGSESNSWQGHTMKRLVNVATGACLTTDNKSEWNAVWLAPCGNRSGQFWTADDDRIQNQNGNFLINDGDDALHTVREYSDSIEFLWVGRTW
ncbi:hypothetical protein ACIQAD_32045 [Streptomyces sp. NPDC088551]|uniref:hypothetical protein n=1 Tax=unclassified Streptomyces TaxID=2593676 RepID=UPI00381EBC98